MDAESIFVTSLLALITLPWVISIVRARSRAAGGMAIAIWIMASATMAWASAVYPSPPVIVRTAAMRPAEVKGDGYVSSRSCKACHPHEYDTWYGSYHRTMTQAATPETVLAPWDDVWIEARGRGYLFERRGDEYWVELDDPDWRPSGSPPGGPAEKPPRVWRQVVQITGAHHWQFYWYATGQSRKVALLLCAYRVIDEPRWMPLDACCVSPPTDGQLSGTGRWSKSCNKCHSTHGRPRIASESEMDTHVAELGIACEACHGPGLEHTTLNRDPRRRYDLHLSGDPDPSIVNPGHLPSRTASLVCGNCHGVTRFDSDEDRDSWNDRGYVFRPGNEDLSNRQFDRPGGEDKFWSDGMVRVSGREYNGLIESPCYERGELECLSCHQMHKPADDPRPMKEWANDQLKLGMESNTACTQCHTEYEDPVAVVEHTHHPISSSGSSCYNCHMPYTTYGLLKGIRSHEIDIPDVSASVETGRPNACNQCHLDRTMKWAADQLSDWYGIPKPKLSKDERTIAASILWSTKGDAGQRALMAWSFGWDEAREASGTNWITPQLLILMIDPYHSVRYIAQRSFGKQPEASQIDYDFTIPKERRYDAAMPAMSIWSEDPLRRKSGEHLMIKDQKMNKDLLNRLLDERNMRDVTLNE